MNKKTVVGAALVALAFVCTAGTIIASNMAFKLNYRLSQPVLGVNASGVNTLSLPDHRRVGLNTAKELMDDIGFASVQYVQRFIKSSNTFLTYTGRAPSPSANNFNLAPGEGYFVKMKTSVDYIVVGSDDPAQVYTLLGPSPSGTALEQASLGGTPLSQGLNLYSWGFSQTAVNAKQLMDDIGFASVDNVQRFITSNNTYQVYTGRQPNPSSNNFLMQAGVAYFIKMRTTVNYVPSFY